MPKYYPIMLDIRKRQAVVVGGDRVAAEKAAALSASGAYVTVISPEFCEELLALSQQVTLRCKTYEYGDLAEAFVVVAATAHDPHLTELIYAETSQRRQLLNVVDVPERCNFIVPSILRRDQLTIAVSTEGTNPGLAKRIRQHLETLFPSAYGMYLRLATVVRSYLRKGGFSYAQRDDFFGDFFHSEVLQQLAQHDEAAALTTTVQLLHHYGLDIERETLTAGLEEQKQQDA
ncbi:MAG: bifunctional precorrin-2 dehydrogenase/sirohydrochlorin ferrochelatase [Chloroflexi bacterium]|nr:bifunctional precorrin-2 dehydrogenase/sirohydrochlorin ferrochelatase [Ktedonobacteraceae bacterium]MBV9707958.1 bifunctional precorrin-2 dehydrogenase/sirohydrochlorin ferrochelatase [Chloroflexota bacterium]